MSERYRRQRQNIQDPVPSTSRGTVLKHSRSQRNTKERTSVNDFREAYEVEDSDSSDIENDDINIPKHSKSTSSSKNRSVNLSRRGKKSSALDDLSSDDEDSIPVRIKRRHRIAESDSDNDSDVLVKNKRGLHQKRPVIESEDSEIDDSESDEDIIPKFKSKKCRLNLSDDNSEVIPDRSNNFNLGANSSNMNGNSSRSASTASRQLLNEHNGGRTRARSTRGRNRRVQRYFLDDEANRRASSEEWTTESESEWDTNWENEWEEHWRNPKTNASQGEESSNIEGTEKHLKSAPTDSKNDEKSADAENSGSTEESKDSCPICLLDFTDQKLGTPASCDHVFCLDCILEWCKVVNTCPADRKEFLSIHVRKHLGGDIVETLPVEDRTGNAEGSDDATTCQICGRGDREETMLLCDSCDLGYHMECLNPPLTEIPELQWLCPECSSGTIPGFGVNFYTLFSVFNEILGDRGLLHANILPAFSPLAEEMLVGPNFFETDGEEQLTEPEEDVIPIRRRLRLNTLSTTDERRERRLRRRTSSHQDTDERRTRSSARGTTSNRSRPSTSGARPQRRSSNSGRSTRSLPTPQSNSNRRSSLRGHSSRGGSSTNRLPQGDQGSSPRERLHSARSLRRHRARHTPTNFRASTSGTSSGSRPIRLIRRRWVDTSSSDE